MAQRRSTGLQVVEESWGGPALGVTGTLVIELQCIEQETQNCGRSYICVEHLALVAPCACRYLYLYLYRAEYVNRACAYLKCKPPWAWC